MSNNTITDNKKVNHKHLRLSMYGLYDSDKKNEHPQKVMESLGIKYQHSTPQSMGDQWWFWNCENIPCVLPEFLSVLENDPMKCIGWGLSEEDAIKIRDYKGN